jgi:ATP-dependent Lhr-like helicase
MPLLTKAIEEQWDPLCILYITPLRALNRDIDRRIAELAEICNLRSDVRHGDTTQSQRTKQSRNPPHLLVTTPETCQLLLFGSRLREGMRNLRAVVIDEVHDLAASERGAQLSVALERIDELCGRRVQRIGLSATVGNPDEMAGWLSPTAVACNAPAPRLAELEVVTEPPTSEDRALSLELHVSPRGLAALRCLASKVRESAPCLIFVNSRHTAETVAQRISKLDSELNIGVHHGSLARETREEMESELQKGNLHGLVCTSSLELGIDVGSIKQVHQIQSPRAVDRLLQRVGRAEHTLGGTSRGMLLSWEPDDIGESAIIARRAMAGELEGVEWRRKPISVAANQLILTAIAEKIIPLNSAATLLRRAPLFTDIEDSEILEIISILDDRRLLKLVEKPTLSDPIDWPPILWEIAAQSNKDLPEKRPSREELAVLKDEQRDKWSSALLTALPKHLADGWFSPGSRSRHYMLSNLSMIADETRYSVRDAVTRRALGNVDETFVLSLDSVGGEEDGSPRRFVMAGRTWQIIDADPEKSELLVAPVSDQSSAPVWAGELPPVPADIAREVGNLRVVIAKEHGWNIEDCLDEDFGAKVNAWIIGLPEHKPLLEYPLSDHSLGTLTQSVAEHLDAAGCIPHSRLLTIEARRDALVLNCCHGSRINAALAHFLQAMASTIDGKSGRVIIDPYRITLQVPALTADSMVTWLTETPPDALRDIMRLTIPNGRKLRARLVQVCKIFGILHRGIDPRRVNLQGIINRYRGTVVLDEALDKLFHDQMDIEGTISLLEAIQSGGVKIEQTASGSLGISPQSERDLLLPNWSDAEVRTRLEERLMNERAVLICLVCATRIRTRVAMYGAKHTHCECGGRMLAAAREGLEERLAEWVASEDTAVRARMEKNAHLVRQRGIGALVCLMARGIGEETASRILARVPKDEHELMLKFIHEAELNYARTRRFWG